jgi:hypothetical protein
LSDEDDNSTDNTISELGEALGSMRVVTSPNGQRTRHQPGIVSPMMPMIPAVPYLVPGGQEVMMDFLLFSGTSRDDLRIRTKHKGRIVEIQWTMPPWFMDVDRLGYESNGEVGNMTSQANAHQEGVRRLRARDDVPVVFTMEYDIPIQVEQRMHPDDIQMLAMQNENRGHEGQFIYYLRLRFRGIADGYVAPAIPAIRFLGQPDADAVANSTPGTPRAPTSSARFGGFFGR